MMMQTGDEVWILDRVDGFHAATVQRVDEKEKTCDVIDASNGLILERLPVVEVQRRSGELERRHLDDMSSLSDLSEPNIMCNLRTRYSRDLIYTSIHDVLVAVNPYRYLPSRLDENYPGILNMVRGIYEDMLTTKQSHSVVVTGESGAGKTESVRLFVNHLATLSVRRGSGSYASRDRSNHQRVPSLPCLDVEHDSADQFLLQERIVQVSPILEAFGNARTSRNNNSSRFGKWVEIEIDLHSGQPISANIRNYMLEKSRIIRHSSKERNFHVFYQILTNSSICEMYGIDPSRRYKLLGTARPQHRHDLDEQGFTSESGPLAPSDDVQGLKQLLTAMEVIGMDGERQTFVFRCLAALLILGDVSFTESADRCLVSRACKAEFEVACEYLGMGVAALEQALTTRRIGLDADHVLKPLDEPASRANLEAFIKSVYLALFEWITEQINVSLDGIADAIEEANEQNSAGGQYGRLVESATIGVLDAFGFEIFQHNSFEQLCINYCNEKMQLHFNRLMFEQDIIEFNTEGILTAEERDLFAVPNEASGAGLVEHMGGGDIATCIRLIEGGRGHGLFALIDDELKIPNGSDASLFRKLQAKHINTACIRFPRPLRNDKSTPGVFTIQHYAGSVTYNIEGFLSKSHDPLPKELQLVCAASRVRYLRESFPSPVQIEALTKGRKANKTLGTQFKEQLNYLSNLIFEESTPHFIRCIKPNDAAKPQLWNGARVLEQVRYAGLVEVTRVRARGFPARYKHRAFLEAFAHLAPHLQVPGRADDDDQQALVDKSAARALVGAMQGLGMLDETSCRVGRTKVFLRKGYDEVLQQAALQAKSLITDRAARVLQRLARKICAQESQGSRASPPRVTSPRCGTRVKAAQQDTAAHCHEQLEQGKSRVRDGQLVEQQAEAVAAEEERVRCLKEQEEAQQQHVQRLEKEELERQQAVEKERQLQREYERKRRLEQEIQQYQSIKSVLLAGCFTEHPRSSLQSSSSAESSRETETSADRGNESVSATSYPGREESRSKLSKETAARCIQKLFKACAQRVRTRELLRLLREYQRLLLLASSNRNETALDDILRKLEVLGFGPRTASRDACLAGAADAASLLAEIKLARLAACNQLDRMTQTLSRAIRGREKRLDETEKHQVQHPTLVSGYTPAMTLGPHGKSSGLKPPASQVTAKKRPGFQTSASEPLPVPTKQERPKRPSILKRANQYLRTAVPAWISGKKRGDAVKKSELDLLLAAIEKAQLNGVLDETETMREAFALVARLEALKQCKPGTALRMFSSSSLLSTASESSSLSQSIPLYDGVPEPALLIRRSERGNGDPSVSIAKAVADSPALSASCQPASVLVAPSQTNTKIAVAPAPAAATQIKEPPARAEDDSSPVSVSEDSSKADGELEQPSRQPSRKLSMKRIFSWKSGTKADDANKEETCPVSMQQREEEPNIDMHASQAPKHTRVPSALSKRSIPEEKNDTKEDIPSTLQRTIEDRLLREKEMRQMIESRYWIDRRGITGSIATEAIVGYNTHINEYTPADEDYSFSSLYSRDRAAPGGADGDTYEASSSTIRTVPESGSTRTFSDIHDTSGITSVGSSPALHFSKSRNSMERKPKRPISLESVGRQSSGPIPRHSAKAYKNHWESLAYINKTVVTVKNF